MFEYLFSCLKQRPEAGKGTADCKLLLKMLSKNPFTEAQTKQHVKQTRSMVQQTSKGTGQHVECELAMLAAHGNAMCMGARELVDY